MSSSFNSLQPFSFIASAKLYRPDSTGCLHRHRLTEILSQNYHVPLILIHAPSGYGKTTLVADFLKMSHRDAIWYHFNDSDKILGSWLQIISNALCMKIQGSNAAHLMEDLFKADQPETIGVILAALFNMIRAEQANPFTLILEDYHRLDNNNVAHKILSVFLEHIKLGHQVFILSRTVPSMSLTHFFINHKIKVLTQQELAFTLKETNDLFREVYHFTLTQAEISLIHTRIEGWASGLYITSEVLHNINNNNNWNSFWCEFADSSRIYDFLLKEALASIDQEYKDFLYNTSIFSSLDPNIIQQLWPTLNVAKILSFLEQNNVFIYLKYPYSSKYRYLNIFRYYLYRRLLELKGSDYIRVLHHRAAIVYEKQEQLDYAVAHHMAAGDYQKIPQMIRELVQRNCSEKLLDMIEGRIERTLPEMEGVSGIALRRLIPLDVYKSLLHDILLIANDSSAERDVLSQAYAQQRLGAYYFYSGNGREALRYLKCSLDIFASNKMTIQGSYSAILISMSYIFQGDVLQAAPHVDDAYVLAYQSTCTHTIANVLYAKAQLMLSKHDYIEAERYARQALAIDCWPSVGETFYFDSLAMALLLQNKTVEASEIAHNALIAAENSHVPYEIGNAYMTLALTEARTNNYDKAEAYINLAFKYLTDYIFFYTRSLIVASEIAFKQSKQNEMETYCRQYKIAIAESGNAIDIHFIENINSNLKTLLCSTDTLEHQSTMSSYSSTMVVRALGNIELRINGIDCNPITWGRAPSRKLFFIFLANHNKLVDKDQIIEELWPNEDYQLCNKRFYVALHTLRKKLGVYASCITCHSKKYSMQLPIDCDYDVDKYTCLAKEGLLNKDYHIIRQAINLYKGDFCENYYEEDALEETRKYLKKIYIQLLETIAEICYDEHNYTEAFSWYSKIHEMEPLLEGPVMQILEILNQQDELNLASNIYLQYARSLWKELGFVPGYAIQTLYQQILEKKMK